MRRSTKAAAELRTRRAVHAWRVNALGLVNRRAVFVDVYTGGACLVRVDEDSLMVAARRGWTGRLSDPLRREARDLLGLSAQAHPAVHVLASGLVVLTKPGPAKGAAARHVLRAELAAGGDVALHGNMLVLDREGGPVSMARVNRLCAGVFSRRHVPDEVADDEAVQLARPAECAPVDIATAEAHVPAGCGAVYTAVRAEVLRLAMGQGLHPLRVATVLSASRLARAAGVSVDRCRGDLASLVTAGVLRRRPCLVDLGDHVKRFDVYGLAQ